MSITTASESKLIASITRESYYEFVKEFWDVVVPEKPVWNWHIELICNEIQEVMERVFRGEKKQYDLVINVCPGSTKSTIASVMLLPWCWARMPTLRSLNGSHTHSLVLEFSRKSRDVVNSEKYAECFPMIKLRKDQNMKGHFANTYGGGRMSCTVAGKSPLGFHAHVHVVDDPIDPKKALSEVEIETANVWMIETLSTRKVEKSVTPLILIMQRLAQNDPSGYQTEHRRKRIKYFCVPAELTDKLEPPELKKYYKEGLMDPVRVSHEVLEEEREKGDFFYSGQFLQDPIPVGGGMFKTDSIKIADQAPDDVYFRHIVRCWDNAGSPKGKSYDRRRKYTVGAKMGLHKDGTYWILDIKRDRYATHIREKLKRDIAEADGLHVEVVQEQEGGSGGQESAENTIRTLAGYTVIVDNPKGDKTLRADPLSTQVNVGNVYMVKAPWNKVLIEELKHFPFSTYKDQVDALSAAFARLFKPKRRVGALFRGSPNGKTNASPRQLQQSAERALIKRKGYDLITTYS